MKQNNVYANADEKFVKRVLVHANDSNNLFYDDAATAEPVKADDLKDLFIKGMTVVTSDGAMYNPVYFDGLTDVVCLSDEATAVTFTAEE